ncbi:MAG: hypothetical protein ACHQ0J_14265 [Candidatus Dormibacterales bacterium]
MRQRTLGIIAGVLLVAGAALGAGTAIVAFGTAPTAHPPTTQPQQRGHGRIGPGFLRPGNAPGARPGGIEGM